MISPATVFTHCPDIRYRIIGGEAVVMRQSDAEVLVLNGVGARILELVASESSVGEIVDTLLAEYDVEREILEQDVRDYLQNLLDGGVIQEH